MLGVYLLDECLATRGITVTTRQSKRWGSIHREPCPHRDKTSVMQTDSYLPFDPKVAPLQKLPAGSVDCHFHVFEDAAKYPYTANRSYTPSLAPWAAFEAMNNAIGADRAVLVHPSVYGHDHATLYDTLRAHPDRLRAVGVLPLDVSDQEIEKLHQAGTRGTRLNILFAGGGQLVSYLHGNRIGVMVEYEGDATAAKDVAMHIAAMKPVSMTSAEVPQNLIEKERSVATIKAAESGKPAEIAAKMIEGSVQKYLKEVSLFDQSFVKNDKLTVAAMLKSVNTTMTGFTLFVVGEGIEKKVDDFAAEVAAQVAAAKGQ